jgi:hypothetical protein
MTFEERIARITERTDAITETIELMIHENRERDAAWEKRFSDQEKRLSDQSADWEKRFVQSGNRLSLIIEALDKLTHVAENHDRRLGTLEGTA